MVRPVRPRYEREMASRAHHLASSPRRRRQHAAVHRVARGEESGFRRHRLSRWGQLVLPEPYRIDGSSFRDRETGAAVCSATRTIHRLDGTMMYTDTFDSNGQQHVDTSCYFFARQAYGLLPLWGMMPRELGPIRRFHDVEHHPRPRGLPAPTIQRPPWRFARNTRPITGGLAIKPSPAPKAPNPYRRP